jgi:hypothetical protein
MGSVSLRSAPKREFYLETAKDMHHRASSETTPQAKEILLDIERSLRRLAEIESWSDHRLPDRPATHGPREPRSASRGEPI